MRIISI
jgi:serine/threonine protein kinase